MLLSIIIPTKNRYTTLFNVVDMILSFNLNDDLEIVIQDNSDNNEEAINYIKCKNNFVNLKYFHSAEKLSVIQNSDKAVLNSTGEYVCFIGDDDGIMPNIIEVTKWMKENKYKALKAYKPNYYWPDQKANYLSSNVSGVLKYKKWGRNYFNIIKSVDALEYTLRKGGVTMKMLPCLYHGIVEKATLIKVFNKTNTFFPGPSPDMANAIALTQVIDEYVYVNYPVIISGKSTKSTGGAGVLHQHIARIEDVGHLPIETAKQWDYRIPRYWTGPTIWAESLIKSLTIFDNQEAIKKIDFEYLYSYLFIFNYKNHKLIFNKFHLKISNMMKLNMLKICVFRGKVFLKNRIGSIITVNNVKDMNKAVQILSEQTEHEKIKKY